MKTRVFIFILATMCFALTAQAMEISMDSGGIPSGSSASGDCATAQSLNLDESDVAAANREARHASAGANSSRMHVSDEAEGESGAETRTGSSAAGKSLAVPVKSRSTRWQSLVPGAIK